MEVMVALAVAGIGMQATTGLFTNMAKQSSHTTEIVDLHAQVFLLGEEMDVLAKQAQVIGVLTEFSNPIRARIVDPAGSDLFAPPYAAGNMLLFLFYQEVELPPPTSNWNRPLSAIYLTRMVGYYRGSNAYLKKFDTDLLGGIPPANQTRAFYYSIPAITEEVNHKNVFPIFVSPATPLFMALPNDGFLMQSRFVCTLKGTQGTKSFDFRLASRTQEY